MNYKLNLKKILFIIIFAFCFFCKNNINVNAYASTTLNRNNGYCYYGESGGKKLKTENDQCSVTHSKSFTNEHSISYNYTMTQKLGYNSYPSKNGDSSLNGGTRYYDYSYIQSGKERAQYNIKNVFVYRSQGAPISDSKTITKQSVLTLVKDPIVPSCTAEARFETMSGTRINPNYTSNGIKWYAYQNLGTYDVDYRVYFYGYSSETNGGSSIDSSAGINKAKYNPPNGVVNLSNNMETNYYVQNKFGYMRYCKLTGGAHRVDYTIPSCSISKSTSKWTNQNITLTISCSDSESGCGPSYKTISSNNTYTYSCVDNAGNYGNNVSINITNIDKVKPTCGATTPINTNYYYNTNYGVKVACSDNASKCTTNSYEGTASTSGYSSITIYDNAGNSNTCPATTQQFDTSAPTTTITLADGHQGYNGLGHQTSVSVVATISATKLPDINTTNKNI